MAAQAELYREIVARVEAATGEQGVRITTVRRLSLPIVGLVAAESGGRSRRSWRSTRAARRSGCTC